MIAEAARQILGARVVVEPRVHADVGLARKVEAPAPNIDHRGDVYIEVDDPKRQKTHRWLVDVVVSHSHSPASELAPPSAPGTGAAAAAKKKRDLYAANYVTGSVTVVPFSCETGGHIDAPGVALLKMLSRLNYEAKVRNALAGGGVNPLAYPVLVRRLTEKVAVAIQRGNARIVNAYTRGGAGKYRLDVVPSAVAAAQAVAAAAAAGPQLAQPEGEQAEGQEGEGAAMGSQASGAEEQVGGPAAMQAWAAALRRLAEVHEARAEEEAAAEATATNGAARGRGNRTILSSGAATATGSSQRSQVRNAGSAGGASSGVARGQGVRTIFSSGAAQSASSSAGGTGGAGAASGGGRRRLAEAETDD